MSETDAPKLYDWRVIDALGLWREVASERNAREKARAFDECCPERECPHRVQHWNGTVWEDVIDADQPALAGTSPNLGLISVSALCAVLVGSESKLAADLDRLTEDDLWKLERAASTLARAARIAAARRASVPTEEAQSV